MTPRLFWPPCAAVSLETDDEDILSLAGALWPTAQAGPASPAPETLVVSVQVREDEGPLPEELETRLVWRNEREGKTDSNDNKGYDASIEGALQTRITFGSFRANGWVSRSVLGQDPGLVTRFLLETPVAVLLSRRRLQVLHAGAVLGARGAVVIRGSSGAGKSTLVAACWKAGLDVLCDESLFAAHEDPDALSATIRDLTVTPESAALLGILGRTRPAFNGGEAKRRVPLPSRPELRRATRLATVLLGPRQPGPARLVALSREEFMDEFRRGSIPEERFTTDPDVVAARWAERDGLRMDGASDLDGAVDLIKMLVV